MTLFEYEDDPSRNYEEVCREAIARILIPKEDADAETARQWMRPTLMRHLLEDMAKSAKQYAQTNDINVDTFEYDILWPGLSNVQDLQYSLIDHSWDQEPQVEDLDFWHHERQAMNLILSNKAPHISRTGIEAAATEYLELPYRAASVERLYVDVLVAMELYAFGNEMIAPRNLPIGLKWLPAKSPYHERHALWGYIVGTFYAFLYLMLPGIVALVYLPSIIGVTIAGWIGGILIGLFCLTFFLDTILLPWRWNHQRKSRAKIRELLEVLISTYGELESDGAVSTRRIWEAASKAAEVGVIWPGPLFALLDDNLGRNGRL